MLKFYAILYILRVKLNLLSYLMTFQKSVKKIQVSLKPDKNDRYFIQRPMYIYDNIVLNSS